MSPDGVNGWSVSVWVITLPHIPQFLGVRINTAQENVQLTQPEFICALGTASWVKLWNCSLGKTLNKPALILYIWFFRAEASRERQLWWILVSPMLFCKTAVETEKGNEYFVQAREIRAKKKYENTVLCSDRRITFLHSPSHKIQVASSTFCLERSVCRRMGVFILTWISQGADQLCITWPIQGSLAYISKTDVLTENSLQVLEKSDSWGVEILFFQWADTVGKKKNGKERTDSGPGSLSQLLQGSSSRIRAKVPLLPSFVSDTSLCRLTAF